MREQSIPTNYGISFPLDKNPDKFLPYIYSPSITNNRLSSDQVNSFLRQVNSLRADKGQNKLTFGFSGLLFCMIMRPVAGTPVPTALEAMLFSGSAL